MKIIIDTFGCDKPLQCIEGCKTALLEDESLQLILCGKKEIINQIVKEEDFASGRLQILDAPEIIDNMDVPTVAIRQKKQSSLVVALDAFVNDENIKAMVSAGSTGAVLVGGLFKIGRMKGVERPALCPIMPTKIENKWVVLADCGANIDCKPQYLLQFAYMGSSYAKHYFGIEKPKVALLSNGVEDKKGNELCKETFVLLKQAHEQGKINFCGNMEARDILSGDFDVVVTDGFAGNVAMKSLEGAANLIISLIKEEVKKTFRGKIGGLLLKPSLKKVVKRMDYNAIGGATMLGLNKVLVKAHGSSNAFAMKSAIFQAKKIAESNVLDGIKECIGDTDDI